VGTPVWLEYRTGMIKWLMMTDLLKTLPARAKLKEENAYFLAGRPNLKII
jgi:hypothetical protein